MGTDAGGTASPRDLQQESSIAEKSDAEPPATPISEHDESEAATEVVPDSVSLFEATTHANSRALRWAKGTAAITLLAGIVATFMLSVAVAENGAGEAAKSDGVTIAGAMLAITLLITVTNAAWAHTHHRSKAPCGELG
jgi:hypothetical protein